MTGLEVNGGSSQEIWVPASRTNHYPLPVAVEVGSAGVV